jgi:glycosyltransferase involved in cell wall biosynthesis
MAEMPRISVVIPHLNQSEALGRCLESLTMQTLPARYFEIIVVDNGSIESPSDILTRFENVRLLREPSPGPGLARNRGVADARGEILAFVDADCRADPHWLSSASEGLEAANSSGVVGGDVRIDVRDPPHLSALEAYESVFAYRQKLYISRDGFSGTGNLAMRRGLFEAVGPFGGIGIAEDRDWGQRARAAGIAVGYVPGMIVFHPARTTLAELRLKWQRHIAHDLAAHRAKGRGAVRWTLRSAAMIASIVPHAAMLMVSGRLSGFANRVRGICVLAAIRGYRAAEMLRQAGNKGESAAAGWNR